MRLFGKFFGGIAKAVGRGMQTVGRVLSNTGIPVVSDIGYNIESAGIDVEYKGKEMSRNIGESAAYDASAPTVQQTVDLHKLLSEYNSVIQKEIDPIEEKILKGVEEFFRQLNKMVEENQLGVQTNYLEKDQVETLSKIKGEIRKYVSRHISLDNHECLNILAMNPGQEKKNRMDAFRKSVLQEATKNMWNELEGTFNKMLTRFWELFDSSLDKQIEQVSKMKDKFDQIIQNDDTATREQAKAEAQSTLSAAQLVALILSSDGTKGGIS